MLGKLVQTAHYIGNCQGGDPNRFGLSWSGCPDEGRDTGVTVDINGCVTEVAYGGPVEYHTLYASSAQSRRHDTAGRVNDSSP